MSESPTDAEKGAMIFIVKQVNVTLLKFSTQKYKALKIGLNCTLLFA